MTDKYRAQTRFVVEVGLERENAEHEIEKARHLFDAATIPSPDLWADVVNDFRLRRLLSQCTREAQIKARIIDQHDRVGFALSNFLESFPKLLSKITVFPNHFPQTKDGCVGDPIFEVLTSKRAHLRTATPDQGNICIELSERAHQRCRVIIRAHFTCDKIDGFGFHPLVSGCSRLSQNTAASFRHSRRSALLF